MMLERKFKTSNAPSITKNSTSKVVENKPETERDNEKMRKTRSFKVPTDGLSYATLTRKMISIVQVGLCFKRRKKAF